MALTWPVVFAVLVGALLHASWNALVKSSADKAVDTALMHFVASVIALPLLAIIGPPRVEAWPFLLGSTAIHVAYYYALVGAYRFGDLGLTYPIMRGFAPLLVALASASLIGEVPSATGWIGIVAITVGVTLVGLSHPGEALHHGKAIAFALANAVIIAMYTLVDGLGVRTSGDVLRYILVLTVLDGLPYPLLLWWRRGAKGRVAIVQYAKGRWPMAALGGAASIGSYSIALWAMTVAPVASVAALRETSVLFAVLIGVFVLGERLGVQRTIGAVAIVAGVMALRLA